MHNGACVIIPAAFDNKRKVLCHDRMVENLRWTIKEFYLFIYLHILPTAVLLQ